VVIYKIANITTKTIIVFFVFLILYLYLPIAHRIYIFLNSELFKSPSNIDSVFGTSRHPASSDAVIDIIWGILVGFFTFVIPPGLICLLAWRMMKKVKFHRKRIYKSIGDKRESSIEGLVDGKEFISTSNNTSLTVKEWLEKGEVLYKSSSYQEAINSYNNAINLSPNYKAYFNRGVVYNKLGNRKQAVSDLKAAASLGHKKSQKILTLQRYLAYKSQFPITMGKGCAMISLLNPFDHINCRLDVIMPQRQHHFDQGSKLRYGNRWCFFSPT